MRTRVGALALALLVAGCSTEATRPSTTTDPPLATTGPAPMPAADARVERLLETVLPTRKDLGLDALGPGDEDKLVREPVLERRDVPPPDPCDPLQQEPLRTPVSWSDARTGRVVVSTPAWEQSLVTSVWWTGTRAQGLDLVDRVRVRLARCAPEQDASPDQPVLQARFSLDGPGTRSGVAYGWSVLDEQGDRRTAAYAWWVQGRAVLRAAVISTGPAPDRTVSSLLGSVRIRTTALVRGIGEARPPRPVTGTRPA